MELGLTALLLICVVAFTLSSRETRIGLLTAMILPVAGIGTIDLARDVSDDSMFKLYGPGGFATVCLVGSIVILLLMLFT